MKTAITAAIILLSATGCEQWRIKPLPTRYEIDQEATIKLQYQQQEDALKRDCSLQNQEQFYHDWCLAQLQILENRRNQELQALQDLKHEKRQESAEKRRILGEAIQHSTDGFKNLGNHRVNCTSNTSNPYYTTTNCQ